ncbi:MAG: patatin-like phospholipase family protein [Lewinellaceae bacterium]|nr:patatin-like phospholipase family protein [Lewinellaceae bacterium]
MKNQDNKQFLKKEFQAIFNLNDQNAVDDLIDSGEIIYVPQCETIISQGEDTDDVYFLLLGRLSVSIKNEYDEVFTINDISQGEFFGEMSLLTGNKRSTTIESIKESRLLKIEGSRFKDLLEKHPALLMYLNGILVNRLNQSNVSKNHSSYQHNCILTIEQNPILVEIIENLLSIYESRNDVYVIFKERAFNENIISATDGKGDKKYKFFNWIRNLEKQYKLLVYICDSNDLEWSELCLLQADRIFLLGTGELTSNQTEVEQTLFKDKNIASKIQKNLIIAWNHKPISKVSQILTNRNVKNVFHITHENDIEKIVRYLDSSSIKLVLGGGGAKGFAHLGVYKAILELGIPIDFVGGTSIGSVIAATIALGWPYEQIKDSCYNAFVVNNPLNDYHLPLVSILRGKKLETSINTYFKDIQIEDIKTSYFAVASNFTESKIEILDHGSLSFAIRASISLPTILPPAVKENSLLFDGGIVDNLPFDHMDTLAQGTSIGVDLSVSKKRILNYERVPNNISLLKQKMLRKRKYKVPSIGQIVMGTMTFASEEKRRNNENKFDIYIKPDLSKYGFLKWQNFHEIVEKGYETALPLLKEWQEKRKF